MIPNEHLTICIDNIPNAFGEQGMVNAEAIHHALETIQGIPVNELKITDLFFSADSCTGVYLFYDKDLCYMHSIFDKSFNTDKPNGDVAYVGKTSGRSLTERIPSHFAPRQKEDYMNIIVKRIAELNKGELKDSFAVSSNFILKIILFTVHDNAEEVKERIYMVEDALIDYYKPYLNKIRGLRAKL